MGRWVETSLFLMAMMLCAFSPDNEPLRDMISVPEIRTVELRNPNDFMAPPVIRLGSDDILELKFDIIGDDERHLRYRIVHCNADWNKSMLTDPEFVAGFNEWQIEDYAHSSNTYIRYVNYRAVIPADGASPIVSGNYVVEVFDEDNPEKVLIRKRFYVTENSVPMTASVTTRTDVDYNDCMQQLVIAADVEGFNALNPFADFILVVTQNNREESAKTIKTPSRLDGRKLIYSHLRDLIFEAGNEYRRFETVRADYPGMGVDSVHFIDGMWHAWLTEDFARDEDSYSYDQTQQGRYKIDEYNSTEPDLGADYVMAHFSLAAPVWRVPGDEILLVGELTDILDDSCRRMKFDRQSDSYSLTIPLKQGSYNYQYQLHRNGASKGFSPIEGNHYETCNEYLVRLYYRPPGSRGDRLVGAVEVKS